MKVVLKVVFEGYPTTPPLLYFLQVEVRVGVYLHLALEEATDLAHNEHLRVLENAGAELGIALNHLRDLLFGV